MIEEKYIVSACVIGNNIAVKNNGIVFSGENKGLRSFLASLYHHLKIDYPKFYKMDNLCKLGWLASEILIKDESLIKEFKPGEIGTVLTNANASLDTDLKYFETTKVIASPALFVYTLSNIVAGEICIRNNFKGENAFFVLKEFNAAFIKAYVDDLFAANAMKLCICGWADVLEENYKAVLYLVSARKKEGSLLFTEENMNRIFKSVEA
ncbi:MAG TPA: hypothetical protein VFW07_15970 [Parafilimonas sp.]|nr:hypothetical protein [Parafilimonas sp.]